MKSALLIVAFIACAASKFEEPDPFEVFLTQLGQTWQRRTCQQLTQPLGSGPGSKNTFQSCLRDTYQLTAETMSEFRPIALNEIDEAVSDLNDTYYQLDPDTKGWTLGGRPAPLSVEGDTENARKLCGALDVKFKELLKGKFGGVAKGSEGGLSKRMASLSASVRSSFDDLSRSLSNSLDELSGAVRSSSGSVRSSSGSARGLSTPAGSGGPTVREAWAKAGKEVGNGFAVTGKAAAKSMDSAWEATKKALGAIPFQKLVKWTLIAAGISIVLFSFIQVIIMTVRDRGIGKKQETGAVETSSTETTDTSSAETTDTSSTETTDTSSTEITDETTDTTEIKEMVVDGITYKLDDETGAWWYVDPDTNEAKWYYG
jgi:hypothetical protein